MTLAVEDTMYRMRDLWNPVLGTIPSGVVASAAVANSRLTFTNEIQYKWSDTDFRFNNQNQKWEQDIRPTFTGPQAYGGVKNCATPRRFSAPAAGMVNTYFPHIIEMEFLFTGVQFSLAVMNLGGNGSGTNYSGDVEMFIEYGGHMWRMSDYPKLITRSDGSHSFYNVVFERPVANMRIRVHFGTVGFSGLYTDTSSIVRPAPDRYFNILDGDSYVESSQALCADQGVHQYFTRTISNYLFQATGMLWSSRGQGATGFFSNGAGQIFDDTFGTTTTYVSFIAVTVTGLSRYLSSSRVNWMTDVNAERATLGKDPCVNFWGNDFGGPLGKRPLMYVLNGTWNDASSGGVSDAVMYARAKECYQIIHTIDPKCTFVHISPEPFDDTLFGSSLGPPTAGDKSDIHRIAQTRAASEVPLTEYINIFGPDLAHRMWTGAGPDPQSGHGGAYGVPTTSQQAQLVSLVDGIHGRMEMTRFFANKILDEIGDIEIPADRVMGMG